MADTFFIGQLNDPAQVAAACLYFICIIRRKKDQSVIHCGTDAFHISHEISIRYSKTFLRIICLAGPSSAINFVIITIFQATGGSWQPIMLSLLRKGGIDVPLMFVFDHIAGLDMIAWATPVADWIVLVLTVLISRTAAH